MALYQYLTDNSVCIFTWDLDQQKGVAMELNGQYAIFMDFDNIHSRAEETVVLAHEGGHVCTGSTHKVCSSYDLVEKHEYAAWKWAVQHFLSVHDLDEAVASGYTEIWSLAEYFGVTEFFMRKAVCWYTHGNLSAELYF